MPERPSPPRWAALDGLRTVAVALVIGYHAAGVLPSGALGVDVFFVLSGFLITTLLVAEHDRTATLGLRAFYRRRAARLVPALVVVCAAVVLASVLTGRDVRAVAEGALSTVLYVSNVWLFTGHGTPLLQHTWTLALESQFYLVWPLLLPLVLRHRGTGIALLLIGLGVGGLDLVASPAPVVLTYVRAVGLPLGCALALALARPGARRWRAVLGPLGAPALVALVVLACLPAGHGLGLGSLPALVPALLAVPVVVALTQPGRFAALLARRELVWVGERSYGLYLWHLPVLTVLINEVPSAVPLPVRLVVGVVLSVLLAAASYRWVERPVLDRAARPRLVARTAQD